MSGEVAVAPAVLDAVYRHARDTYPEECCGFLLGPRDSPENRCDEAQRCENRQNVLHAEDPVRNPRTARTAYQLGAKDLLLLGKSLRGERPVKVVYHSHIDAGAYFSAEDQRAATLDGEPAYPVAYLVIDAQVDRIGGARLFSFDEARRTFVERTVFPAPAPSAMPAKRPPPPPPGREQRRHPRIGILAQVELSKGGEIQILSARNASLGGLFLEAAPSDFPDLVPGVVVHVGLFSSEDGTERVRGEATVVRIDGGTPGVRPAGFGLMWRTLDPETAEALARFLGSPDPR